MFVLQTWVEDLTFMQQSVLITSCRGPDGIRKDHPVKLLNRALRRSFMIRAFEGDIEWDFWAPGGGSFTGAITGTWAAITDSYLRTVDELPHHYQLHIMHAAEVLGYKHPDHVCVRGYWMSLYFAIVNDAHLLPESEDAMDKRLGDYEEHWKAAAGTTAR